MNPTGQESLFILEESIMVTFAPTPILMAYLFYKEVFG
jgi:hypothetical protein